MGSYFRPSGVPDALAALAAQPTVCPLIPLAGGTDYYPARVVHAPDDAILDLSALPGLRRIEARGDHWWIPCLATWTDIIETPLPAAFDALKQAARQVGGVQIQNAGTLAGNVCNAGTLAGNVCNASPAADGVPCLANSAAATRSALPTSPPAARYWARAPRCPNAWTR
jgi:CO/xanthine dehydrogenase FAD-binding subunit